MGSFRRGVVSLFTRRTWLGSGESNLSLDVMRSRGCGYECRVWRVRAESGRRTAVVHRYCPFPEEVGFGLGAEAEFFEGCGELGGGAAGDFLCEFVVFRVDFF